MAKLGFRLYFLLLLLYLISSFVLSRTLVVEEIPNSRHLCFKSENHNSRHLPIEHDSTRVRSLVTKLDLAIKAIRAKHHNQGAKKSHLANSTKQARVERRSLPLNYTEQEIDQWREERRKNHPSRSNIEKKLAEKETQSEVTDSNAKRRRQQLKEILAKQAELGIEVAELPPNYLSDSEKQVCGKEGESQVWGKKGKFQNKYGKKRRGKHGNANRFAKKQKSGDNDSFTPPALNKRKNPTLLQKLLSADIKRDKSHLLQALRFMVMNSFFKDYPEKPLEFPLVTVKEGDGCKSKVKVMEKKSSPQHKNGISAVDENGMIKEVEGSKDHNEVDENNDNDDENEAKLEEIGKSEEEEGEITG